MTKTLAIIGVPSSAGAHAPGQEKAPEALRKAGLLESLEKAGIKTVDYGDSETFRWFPDQKSPYAQHIEEVVKTVKTTSTRVKKAIGKDQVVLVIGGDCTIEIGTVLGHIEAGKKVGLIYFDLHPDLNVPEKVSPGALDWMGCAHMLGHELAVEKLAKVGSKYPLLDPSDIFFFSFGPKNSTKFEKDIIKEKNIGKTTVNAVAKNPEKEARKVLRKFASKFDTILVHFDVDTIDFVDLPLSENTGHNMGLTLDQAKKALKVILQTENLSALTLGEINPDHGSENGETLEKFIEALVECLQGGLASKDS